MRAAFVSTLMELAERDRRILLLTGDLGYTVLEPFAERFRDRFFNVGVAEQNMVGLATGLAEAGYVPFVYSIATFAVLRPYEFIRNGPIAQRLPVRIVGVGGGFEYGPAGFSHHALEDVALMRCQPGLAVLAPADHEQAAAALRASWDLPGPVYYRLGKDDRLTVPGLRGRFQLGRAEVVREGGAALMITMGSVASEAVAAADDLAARGIDCTLLVVACLNPPPVLDLGDRLSHFETVLTVEEHYVVGGLGSLVSEVVAERGLGCRVVRCGVKSPPAGVSGSQASLRQEHGLSREALARRTLQALKGFQE